MCAELRRVLEHEGLEEVQQRQQRAWLGCGLGLG